MIAPPAFDPVSAWGIGGLAVIVAVAWIWTWTAHRPAARLPLTAGVGTVMAASALAAETGVLQRFDMRPPPMAVMIASIFALAFAVGFSSFGRSVATHLPLRTLVGLQAFRFPLELLMHRAGRLGIMPPELSYSGYSFDIVTGIGALVLWALMRARVTIPAWGLSVWNLWGCWCLAVIAVIAVTTSPMLRLFGDDPRHVNTWVLFFPYVWLPAVLVTIAIASHVVITRRLFAGSNAASSNSSADHP